MAHEVIPPGQAILLVPPQCETVRAGHPLSGLMISRRGQISILVNGAGASVALAGPEELRELAMVLAGVAGQWEADLCAAAKRAGDELDAVVASRTTVKDQSA